MDASNTKIDPLRLNLIRLKLFIQLVCDTKSNQEKNCGTFELLRINEVALPSFLEFISSGYFFSNNNEI